MQQLREPPSTDAPANDAHAPTTIWRVETLAPLWRILSISGFGVWAWLGLALALGFYPAGRNGSLIPLSVGSLLVGASLLVACLPWRGAADWYGWRPLRDSRPTHSALFALSTFLPMLAVAGLVRGDNIFWATRLAGAILTLSCVATMAYTGYHFQRHLSGLQRAKSSLPINRLAFAGYAGGLWLWLCTLVDGELATAPGLYPWILLLPVFALLLGLLEGMDWQSLRKSDMPAGVRREQALRPARFVAALFTYAIPCIALLLARIDGAPLIAAALAVPSCLLGKWMERFLYESWLGPDGAGD